MTSLPPAPVLHIACSTDPALLADCAVMLASLLANNPPRQVHVHLLYDDSLSDADVDRLGAIVTGAGGRFNAIAVGGDAAPWVPHSERFSLRAWYRILLPDLLPRLDRVLYIDADAMVTGRLEPLWQTDLGDHLVGAVTNGLFDNMVPRIRSELGLRSAADYFNSGVLLIDLAGWRRAGTTASIAGFVRDHPGLFIWADQDALNAVLHERRLKLHPRWNAVPAIWAMPRRYLPHTREQISQAAANPAIVHFVGPHKPWHYRSRHPYRDQWFAYLEGTPWRGRSVEGRTPWQVVLRPLPMLWSHKLELALFEHGPRIRTALDRFRARLSLRARLGPR